MKRIVALILMLVFATAVFSFDLSFYNSFQTLCMGEAFTAVANDANTLSYNPAGLTSGKGFVLNLSKMSLDMSQGFAAASLKALTHMATINEVIQSNNSLEIANYFLNNYANLLFGRNEAAIRDNAYIGYEGENFAVVGYAIGQGYVVPFISNDLVPFVSLHAAAAAYGGISSALAMNVGEYKLSFGGTYRYGYKIPDIYSIEDRSVLTLNSSDLEPNLEYYQDSNVDLGFKLSHGKFKAGVLLHDIASTNSSVRIGIGYVAKQFTADVDFEKLFNGEYSFFRRLHVGISYSPFSFLKIYGGLSAGWFTGGLEMNIGPLSICAGSYVVNYGYSAGYNAQRMYTLSVGI